MEAVNNFPILTAISSRGATRAMRAHLLLLPFFLLQSAPSWWNPSVSFVIFIYIFLLSSCVFFFLLHRLMDFRLPSKSGKSWNSSSSAHLCSRRCACARTATVRIRGARRLIVIASLLICILLYRRGRERFTTLRPSSKARAAQDHIRRARNRRQKRYERYASRNYIAVFRN